MVREEHTLSIRDPLTGLDTIEEPRRLEHRFDNQPNAVLERVSALDQLWTAVEESAVARLLALGEGPPVRPLPEPVDERIAALAVCGRAADDLIERRCIRDELPRERFSAERELVLERFADSTRSEILVGAEVRLLRRKVR
jgi:hypothetical protein